MPKVTLGGNRLGSGNRMKVDTRTYNRSTFNLSRNVRTTAACGTLIPFIAEPVLKEDIWKINTQSAIYTAPTIGPLYGSFKVQFDYFFCPQRLYQGILHNNTTGIGLKMGQVKMPVWDMPTGIAYANDHKHIGDSHLLAYLGLRRTPFGTPPNGIKSINMTKMLAYYDIYKTYYANKQEPMAKIIGRQTEHTFFEEFATIWKGTGEYYNVYSEWRLNQHTIGFYGNDMGHLDIHAQTRNMYTAGTTEKTTEVGFPIYIKKPIVNKKPVEYENGDITAAITTTGGNHAPAPLKKIEKTIVNGNGSTFENPQWLEIWETRGYQQMYLPFAASGATEADRHGNGTTNNPYYWIISFMNVKESASLPQKKIKIIDFPLENIDKAREVVLTNCRLGDQVKIGAIADGNNVINFPPYNMATDGEKRTDFDFGNEQQGLALKTYQSDIFNNWLQTEWIDGENGIAEITAIDTSGGSFKLDQLNLNQKLYNMLNAIAVHGNTYQDWAEATTGYKAYGQAESPIYLGGASCDIVFQEVISTADTETGSAGDQPLGTLGGKGVTTNHKGGNIKFTANEFGYIIGLMSITPRVDYSQGNHWDLFNTDMDSWHKPALDGIGFQDLLTTRMEGSTIEQGVGKQTAWIHYQTAYNETFGEFAKENSQMFMTLNRRYEVEGNKIKDLTTYIDPAKYNYAFAKTSIDSQNFWVQIGMKIETRRLMAARQIPMM